MTTNDVVLLAVAAALAFGLALLGAVHARDRRNRQRTMSTSAKRILFPFVGHALSKRALDGALRIALADHSTLVPVYLARVPMQMPLDAPLPRQCEAGLPLLELIEQRSSAVGVPVDARIERGRSLRHGLREAIDHENFDRIVIAAAGHNNEGVHSDDVAWLLDNAPGEVVIIRPGDDDPLTQAPARIRRRAGAPAGTERVAAA